MSWPTWLSNTLPAWLEKTGYPFNGVGDLEDLYFGTQSTEYDRWSGFVTPGWFYYNNQEDYSYIQKGTQTFTSATTGTVTASVSFRPSWGPILLNGSLYGPYVQHHNIYQPGISVTWTQIPSTQTWYYDLTTTQYLVGLRDLKNTVFGATTSINYPLTESLYYYDTTANRVYVVSPISAPDNIIFLDVLNSQPQLKFYESLIVDSDLTVKLSYLRPYGMNSIKISRGTLNITPTSGYPSATTNQFDVTGIAGIKEGDWVVAEYYINNSFIVTAHNTISYYTNTLGNETVTISFETSIPTTNQPLFVNNSIGTGNFNLNPTLSDGFRSGYLIYTDQTPIWTPAKVTIDSDRDFFNVSGQAVKFKVILRDTNGLPVPNKAITVNVNGATILSSAPSTAKTDNKGEYHILVTKSSSITLTVTQGSLSATKTVTLLTMQSALSQITTSTLKQSLPVFTQQVVEDRTDVYGTILQIDGTPSVNPTFFTPQTNNLFVSNGNAYQSELSILPSNLVDQPMGQFKISTYEKFSFLLKGIASQSVLGDIE